MLRIVLFDDNARFSDSVNMLLSTTTDMRLVYAARDTSQLVQLIQQEQPDVVLMDIDMPGKGGIEGVGQLRARFPDLPVLMLTGFEDADKVFASLCAGANGYILKSAGIDLLVQHIRDVHQGGAPMTPLIAKKVLDRFLMLQPVSKEEDFNLSDREKEVLQYLVKGHSYKMIAAEMEISYETVHTHIRKIYKKLHVNSVSEAVSKTLTLRYFRKEAK